MKLVIASSNYHTYFSRKDLHLFRKYVDQVIILEKNFNLDVKQIKKIKEPTILALDPDYCQWSFSKKEIKLFSNLKAVSLQTSSSHWVDKDFLNQKNILLVHIPNVFANAVAEWLLMSTLILMRQVPLIIKSGFKQEDYTQPPLQELTGKTVGIIGLGAIGKLTAEKFQALGAKVVYWSRKTRDDRFQFLELESLIKQADVLIITLAKNSETKELVFNLNYTSLKQNAIVLSAETELLDFKVLNKLVKAHKIYGYAWELSGMDINFNKYTGNVWVTPQYAWFTQEALERANTAWMDDISQAIQLFSNTPKASLKRLM